MKFATYLDYCTFKLNYEPGNVLHKKHVPALLAVTMFLGTYNPIKKVANLLGGLGYISLVFIKLNIKFIFTNFFKKNREKILIHKIQASVFPS